MLLYAPRQVIGARLSAAKHPRVEVGCSGWANAIRVLPVASYRVASLSTATQSEHAWSPSSSMPLNTFLRKNQPSVITKDDSSSWIWVQRLDSVDEPLDFADLDSSQSRHAHTIERGKEILEEYTKKIIAARRDKSITTQGDTEPGTRSNAQFRQELAAEATERLKQLSKDAKLTSGKWLFYLPERHVDKTFARFSQDLIGGALSKTAAFAVKASAVPISAKRTNPHLISLYLPDLHDEMTVTEVLRVATRSIGARANSAKLDLFTLIGLTRNHPSGIKSTIWNPADLISDIELKELSNAYWNDARGVFVEASDR